MATERCAVCGKGESLAPFRDIAKAEGWPHELAHLDCVRYRVSTRPLRSWTVFSTGERYYYKEIEPGLFQSVFE